MVRDDIAVIIPCYNEALTIGKVVDDFHRELPEATVYVYDNNSKDGTADIAREHGAIVKFEGRQGKGNVIRAMFEGIDADVYVMADGDDTYPADAAPAMVAKVLEGYDMVIGSIANDRMFYVLDSFFEGTITDTALVKSLSALKLGRQYVAITQKACDAVKIEREVQLLWMERQALKKSSEQNRSNGIAFANQICKEYRREGRFFDEILDGAKQRR